VDPQPRSITYDVQECTSGLKHKQW
jgi:hypothetical protein